LFTETENYALDNYVFVIIVSDLF